MRWVRPALTTVANSSDFVRRVAAKCARAGTRPVTRPVAAARRTAEGNTSLLDWLALTSSLGWTSRPRRSPASEASTSFMFMFDEVPEPVW